MDANLIKEINKHLKEIEVLYNGVLSSIDTITTGNLSHRICGTKYLAREIGIECNRIREKIREHRKDEVCNNI